MKRTRGNMKIKKGGNSLTQVGIDTNIDSDKKPIVISISKEEANIEFDPKNADIVARKVISYPKGIYGFNHYLHQTREKMTIKGNFKGKKKVYKITDPFYEIIDEYENDLTASSKSFFNNTDRYAKSFYKIWEILMTFNILDTTKTQTIISINDDSNILSSILNFREKYGNIKGDNFYVSEMISKKKLTFPKNVNLYADDTLLEKAVTKVKANLVLANYHSRLVIQEQVGYLPIINYISIAVSTLVKGGNFVCKFYESFTEVTIKLIYYLSTIFDKVHIYKPLTSKKSSPEKFLVCKSFSGNDKSIQFIKAIKEKSNVKYLNDFMTELILPTNFRNSIIFSNVIIENQLFQNINEMVDFINKENYRGDDYIRMRQKQIDSTAFWTSIFYTDATYEVQNSILLKFIEDITEKNIPLIQKYNKLSIN